MDIIRNLIYLDEYKLYSIVSQAFKGFPQSLTNYKKGLVEEQDLQEDEPDSGRIMLDILKFESGYQEKKHLHDYSYSLLEAELEKEKKIVCVDENDFKTKIKEIESTSFVKIKSRVLFNDIKKVKSLIKNFNDIGEAIAYMGSIDETKNDTGTQTNKRRKSTTSRNVIKNLAKAQGLYLDDDFLNKLALLLDFGFEDQFKLQMNVGPYLFSADCNRQHFREDESSLIRKYSRFPTMKFVLVGIVTQHLGEPEKPKSEKPKSDKINEHIIFLTHALFDVESEFSGKLENEIIIDPIAVYFEL